MLKTTRPATVPQISPEYRSAPAFFIDPEGIAMIWRRDMVRLLRQRSRLLGAVARALVWLIALGFGLRGSLGSIAGFSYEQFVFPGVIAMTVIFSGLQSAISIVYDREFGFLKEVQVAFNACYRVMSGRRFKFDYPGADHSDLCPICFSGPESPERSCHCSGNLCYRPGNLRSGRGHRYVDHRLRELWHHPELYYPATLHVLRSNLPNPPGSAMVPRYPAAQSPHLWRQCYSRGTPGL